MEKRNSYKSILLRLICLLGLIFHEFVFSMEERREAFGNDRTTISILSLPEDAIFLTLNFLDFVQKIETCTVCKLFNNSFKKNFEVNLKVEGHRAGKFLERLEQENPFSHIRQLNLSGNWYEVDGKIAFPRIFDKVGLVKYLKLENTLQSKSNWISLGKAVKNGLQCLSFDTSHSSQNISHRELLSSMGELETENFFCLLPPTLQTCCWEGPDIGALLAMRNMGENVVSLTVLSPQLKLINPGFVTDRRLDGAMNLPLSLTRLTLENHEFKSVENFTKFILTLPPHLKNLTIIGYDFDSCSHGDFINSLKYLPIGIETFYCSRMVDSICFKQYEDPEINLDLSHLHNLQEIQLYGGIGYKNLNIITVNPISFTWLPSCNLQISRLLLGEIIDPAYFNLLEDHILERLVNAVTTHPPYKINLEMVYELGKFFKLRSVLTGDESDLETAEKIFKTGTYLECRNCQMALALYYMNNKKWYDMAVGLLVPLANKYNDPIAQYYVGMGNYYIHGHWRYSTSWLRSAALQGYKLAEEAFIFAKKRS